MLGPAMMRVYSRNNYKGSTGAPSNAVLAGASRLKWHYVSQVTVQQVIYTQTVSL